MGDGKGDSRESLSVAILLAVQQDALLEWDENVRPALLPAPAGGTNYCISLASADVTILDDESVGGMLARNVDGESTGLTSSTVEQGAASIDLSSGGRKDRRNQQVSISLRVTYRRGRPIAAYVCL